jgi:hypothetical protein
MLQSHTVVWLIGFWVACHARCRLDPLFAHTGQQLDIQTLKYERLVLEVRCLCASRAGKMHHELCLLR